MTHSLLELHDVHSDHPLLADLLFLAAGIAMLAIGFWFLRSSGIRPRAAR